jgi:hypothetical protein
MKRSKIFYVPGMISLIFLPILCVWYLKEHKNIQRCLEVTYARKYDLNDNIPLKLDTSILSKSDEKRQYKIYILTGDLKSDSIKELNYRLNAKQIIETKDTLNGIHVIFGDNINFNQYIKTLDFFYKNRKPYNLTKTFYHYNTDFLLFENHLWFSNKSYHKTKNTDWECQIQIIEIKHKTNFNNKFKDWIDNQRIILKLWPFFVIFIVFTIISLRYTKIKTTQ